MSSSASHAHHGEAHQKPLVGSMGVDSRKLGLWAFIGSETLFFATLMVTHLIFYARTSNTLTSVGALEFLDPRLGYLGIELTTVLATLLLASSLTMVLALAASKSRDWKRFRFWQLATILLGASFVGGQIYEFTHLYHEGLKLAPSYEMHLSHEAYNALSAVNLDPAMIKLKEAGEHATAVVPSLFGVTFFVLTGFHGLHVTIGIIWLLAVYVKVARFPDSPENPMDIELGGLYWHFVDLVWVGIFTLIYLI
jgi:cytochrome c oxidase subunit 3/cytochrome o ubiquinol oxidase subunit 3